MIYSRMCEHALAALVGVAQCTCPIGGKDAKGNVIDANNFAPIGFTEVDDTKFQLLNAKLNYQFKGGPAITIGYMFEKFEIKDFVISARGGQRYEGFLACFCEMKNKSMLISICFIFVFLIRRDVR